MNFALRSTGLAAPSPAADPSVPDARRPIIRIRGLRKTRDANDHHFWLVVPEFDVYPGDFVVVLGGNGCGKSTLLDMLGLILECDEAEEFTLVPQQGATPVEVRGLKDSARAAIRRRSFGYVLQSGGLLRFLSARGNASISCQLNGVPGTSEIVTLLATQFQIKDFLGRKPGQLSGGQRQRTAIIRALSHGPAVVLADEPTANIDKLFAQEVIEQLQGAAAERGAAVILVTHDSHLVADSANRVFTFMVELVPVEAGEAKTTRSTLVESYTHPVRRTTPRPVARTDTAPHAVAVVTPAPTEPEAVSVEVTLKRDPVPDAEAVIEAAADGARTTKPHAERKARQDLDPTSHHQSQATACETTVVSTAAAEIPAASQEAMPLQQPASEAGAAPESQPPSNAQGRNPSRRAHDDAWRMVLLAWADLRHEWLMDLCLALALVAVIAPLLLGLGLKSGMIKTLFDRLRDDPRYYEIASAEGAQTTNELLAYLQQRPEVDAVIRRPGEISSNVYVDSIVRHGGADTSGAGGDPTPLAGAKTVELEATEGRDPLLLKSQGVAPLADQPEVGITETVLTETAEATLGGTDGLLPGDVLNIRVMRTFGGRLQEVPWRLRVAAVSHLRAVTDFPPASGIYVPLSLLEDIESYKNGSPIASRKWLGGLRVPAAPVFDGAIVIVRDAPSGATPSQPAAKDIVREIGSEPGWDEPRILTAADLKKQTGLQFNRLLDGPAGDLICYVPSKGNDGVGSSDFADLREFFRRKGYMPVDEQTSGAHEAGCVAILPWVAPAQVELHRDPLKIDVAPNNSSAGSSEAATMSFSAAGFSVDADTARVFGVEPRPPWPLWTPLENAGNPKGAAPPPPSRQLILLAGRSLGNRSWRLLVPQGAGGELALPIGGVVNGVSPDMAYLPAELAGILRVARVHELVWDSSSGNFFPKRSGYAGFRLYTKQIEDVLTLEHDLNTRGLRVEAHSGAISNVIDLDHQLSDLFRVVAIVGCLGSLAVLTFSLVGSVERKSGDFSILRLIGIDRGQLLVFPLFQSLVITAAAYGFAWGCVFLPAAYLINQTIGPRFDFQPGEVLCYLPVPLGLQGLALTLGISAAVSVVAGRRATLADPAAALRQE